jgi:hypothetical protein
MRRIQKLLILNDEKYAPDKLLDEGEPELPQRKDSDSFHHRFEAARGGAGLRVMGEICTLHRRL